MPEKTVPNLGELVEGFLLSKRVSGLSLRTLDTYQHWLHRFSREHTMEPLDVRRFFADLRERGLKPSSVQTAYGALRTFFRWCMDTGLWAENPLRGFSIRVPKTLPTVPTEDDLRAVLVACGSGFHGRRNRALILVLADAGLRASEVLRLLVEDWRPTDRGLFVRSGKGAKDRVAFIAPTTVRALRSYLGTRRLVTLEEFLFADAQGRPIQRRHLVQILHRLSKRAGLPLHGRIHPHAPRHFAATSWLRHGVGLDEVRRLLGHESLSTTLRYSSLVSADLQVAHKRAAAIERLRLD